MNTLSVISFIWLACILLCMVAVVGLMGLEVGAIVYTNAQYKKGKEYPEWLTEFNYNRWANRFGYTGAILLILWVARIMLLQ